MRFCIVSTQQHWGGGEALLHAMATELISAGHSICWIARRDSSVAERLRESQQEIIHALHGRGGNIQDWWSTVRALRAWGPDVVILNDTHAVPLAGSAVWFSRLPAPLRLAYKHTIFPLRSKLKYQILTDKLICVSAAARETLIQGGLAPKQALVIYGGCRQPESDSDVRIQIRRELRLVDGQTLVVCVGNLLACKGHADLLEAVAIIRKSEPTLQLVIAGEGEERINLEQTIDRLDLASHVQLLGYRADAERLLAAADLVVHPSHSEGLSLVLIQAQMLRKPIVATAVGGTVEVLNADDELNCTSWIATAKHPSSLAEQILLALTEIRSDNTSLPTRLEVTAIRASQLFDIRVNTQQLVQECTKLLPKKRGRPQQTA